MKIKINNKQWTVITTMGILRRLRNKYKDELKKISELYTVPGNEIINKLSTWDEEQSEKITDFLLIMVWEMIKPNIFGKKPFKTFDNFCENINPDEFNEASKKIFWLVYGLSPKQVEELEKAVENTEDRKQGNSEAPILTM